MKHISKTDAFVHGFRLTLVNFWLWIKIFILEAIFLAIFSAVVGIIYKFIQRAEDPIAMAFTVGNTIYSLSVMQLVLLIAWTVIFSIFMFGIWVGYQKIMLEVDDTDRGHVVTLFSGFGKVLPKMLLATVLYCLIVVCGLILFVVPGIIFMVRFFFINWLILDKNLGIIGAFKRSWAMTKGCTWPLCLFVLCSMILTLFFKPWAFFFSMPITFLASIYVYRKM